MIRSFIYYVPLVLFGILLCCTESGIAQPDFTSELRRQLFKESWVTDSYGSIQEDREHIGYEHIGLRQIPYGKYHQWDAELPVSESSCR